MQVNESKEKCIMGGMCGVFRVLRSVVGITEMGLCRLWDVRVKEMVNVVNMARTRVGEEKEGCINDGK